MGKQWDKGRRRAVGHFTQIQDVDGQAKAEVLAFAAFPRNALRKDLVTDHIGLTGPAATPSPPRPDLRRWTGTGGSTAGRESPSAVMVQVGRSDTAWRATLGRG